MSFEVLAKNVKWRVFKITLPFERKGRRVIKIGARRHVVCFSGLFSFSGVEFQCHKKERADSSTMIFINLCSFISVASSNYKLQRSHDLLNAKT